MPIMSKQWFGVRREKAAWDVVYDRPVELRHYSLSKEHAKRLQEAAAAVRTRMNFDTVQEMRSGGVTWPMVNGLSAVRGHFGMGSGGVYIRPPSRTRRSDIPKAAWQFGALFANEIDEIENLINQQVPARIRAEVAQAFEPMRGRAEAVKAILNTVIPRPDGQWGYLELPQFAIYDYYTKVGIYLSTATKGFIWEMVRLSRMATPWLAGRASVFLSARPRVRFDDSGRVHSEAGPAIDFGCKGGVFYAWRGLIVPEFWFTGRLTAKRALGYRNAEMRRAACDKLGWVKILKDLRAVTVDRHHNPQIGTLVEVDFNGQRERFLQVRCGTGREFAIPVPGDVDSALAANAWSYGFESSWNFTVPEVRS